MPCPAIGSISRPGPGPPPAAPGPASSIGSTSSLTCRSAPSRGVPTDDPACMMTPRAPSRAPRSRQYRTAAADRSLVPGSGEARFTRYGVWTKTGHPRRSASAPSSSSCAGSDGGSAQPRGLAAKT